MAYQVGSACYETALQATQAIAAQHVPLASHPYFITVDSVAEQSITWRYVFTDNGVATLLSQPVALQPCNMLTAQDAVDVGWMIGAAWLAVMAVTFLIRYLRGETEGLDNASNA